MPGRAYVFEMLICVMTAGCSSTVTPSEHTTRDGSIALLRAITVRTYLPGPGAFHETVCFVVRVKVVMFRRANPSGGARHSAP